MITKANFTDESNTKYFKDALAQSFKRLYGSVPHADHYLYSIYKLAFTEAWNIRAEIHTIINDKNK
jgi:hypothetical protein